MEHVTGLQRRLLVAAMVAGGRLIVWALPSGRLVVPGFEEDAADAVRTLRGAGLVTVSGGPIGEGGNPGAGSHIVRCTEAGWQAARRVVRGDAGTGTGVA